MKFMHVLALASTAIALPTSIQDIPITIKETKRQVGSTANDFKNSGCNDIVFLFARGTGEDGNMGTIVGPAVANNLKAAFPNRVAVQGVDYAALLLPNLLPGGAAANDIAIMEKLIGDVTTKCPNSIIVTGGYSQGAALNHRAIEDLPQAQKNRIAAVITFGDTQNKADNGRIPNFPTDKVLIICAENPRDGVCDGDLAAAAQPQHLSYSRYASRGSDFLISKIRAL